MELIKVYTNTHGKIKVFFDSKLSAFITQPSGFISTSLLKKYLQYIEVLDESHKTSFHHIVDTSKVIFASPLNPFYLRRISSLKNIGHYIVIVPSAFLYFFVKLFSWVNRPDVILRSVAEGLEFIEHERIKTCNA